MARVTIVCCLFAVLALVCWKVQGDDVCREYDLGAFAAMLGKLQMELSSFQNQIKSQRKSIEALEKKNDDMQKKINALEKKNDAVGFTARGVKEVSSSGDMRFLNVTTNTENIYNLTTGMFTCKTPGYYYFSTSLLKEDDYNSYAYCRICKNNVPIAWAYTRPGDSPHRGWTVAVTSTYIRLAAGDAIKLGVCTKTASWNKGSIISAFSGFLTTADAA